MLFLSILFPMAPVAFPEKSDFILPTKRPHLLLLYKESREDILKQRLMVIGAFQ